MDKIKIIATTNFGLESIVKRELLDLGYDDIEVSDGRLSFIGDLRDIAILNLRLRCAERVLIELSNFEAKTFEELFDGVYSLDWEKIISKNGNFLVQGRSHKSKLFSISDCQRITEKAIIKKLQTFHDIEHFPKDGERYKIEVSLLKDMASITLDTSGEGLHKRGYREASYKAPLTETIAAALVKLSYWNKDRILWDPFCGSGTILIEAAMIGKNIAPGLMRKFDSEEFIFMDSAYYKEEKARCYSEIDYDRSLELYGTDISHKAIEIAKMNAEILGLEEDIKFFVKDIKDLDLIDEYGVIITNPPYGIRIGEIEEVRELEENLASLYSTIKTWSVYVITADEDFEKNFKKKSNRNRKLYNGGIKTYYYQYYGPRPK
ncbi:MAG: THUMP domain-containing class I SAM-dependent RNA methyltransferase [Peptoniphilaceae bacterium]